MQLLFPLQKPISNPHITRTSCQILKLSSSLYMYVKISQLVENCNNLNCRTFFWVSDLKYLSYTILTEIYCVSPLPFQANTGIVLQVTSL